MIDIRQRKFTDAVKPVRMRHPLNIELFKKNLSLFLYLWRLLLQIIKNKAVVNTFYFNQFLFRISIIQFFRLFYKFCQAYNRNMEIILCAIKINSCFLRSEEHTSELQ